MWFHFQGNCAAVYKEPKSAVLVINQQGSAGVMEEESMRLKAPHIEPILPYGQRMQNPLEMHPSAHHCWSRRSHPYP